MAKGFADVPPMLGFGLPRGQSLAVPRSTRILSNVGTDSSL